MSNDTITIDLGAETITLNDVNPVEFSWNESDMTTGFVAQEVGTAFTTMASSSGTTLLGNNPTSVTIGPITSTSGGYTISSPFDDIVERLTRLEQIIAEEEEVRKNHPAVQMAYDEYRLLYILAKKNTGDYLTEE
jgi:hypothetical protein